MGYTHYWYQQRDFTAMEWDRLQNLFWLMHDNLPKYSENGGGYYSKSPIILRGYDGIEEIECNNNMIAFNGMEDDKDLSHETCLLTRQKEIKEFCGEAFNFCKTARKPYDLAVCTILLLASEVAPNVYKISSDGDMEGDEWMPAQKFTGKILQMEDLS